MAAVEPRTRDVEEIQLYHDVLWQVVTGKIPVATDPKTIKALGYSLDVLCWVLGHAHNDTFGENVQRLMTAIEAEGYCLKKYPLGEAPSGRDGVDERPDDGASEGRNR